MFSSQYEKWACFFLLCSIVYVITYNDLDNGWRGTDDYVSSRISSSDIGNSSSQKRKSDPNPRLASSSNTLNTASAAPTVPAATQLHADPNPRFRVNTPENNIADADEQIEDDDELDDEHPEDVIRRQEDALNERIISCNKETAVQPSDSKTRVLDLLYMELGGGRDSTRVINESV